MLWTTTTRRRPKPNACWGLAVVTSVLVLIYLVFLLPSNPNHNSGSPRRSHVFFHKLQFRRQALASPHRKDEVIYFLRADECTDKDLLQVFRSASILKKRCTRCDFDLTLVVQLPNMHTALMMARPESAQLFSRILYSPPSFSLPQILLSFPTLPFVVYLDSHVISNHRFFPESIFDLLHKEYDLLLPIDGALRSGPLYGRGIPGLSSKVIGFLNAPSVATRVFSHWYNAHSKEFSESFAQAHFPDVKLFALSLEWLCDRESQDWIEGNQVLREEFKHLTGNPCKSYIERPNDERLFLSRTFESADDWNWIKGSDFC